MPFMRAHSDIHNPLREPWLQTERVQDAVRAAINRRYDLIHYLYTLFHLANKNGTPIMRPMWYEFYNDPTFYKV